jgi:hypothetical protein
MARPNLTGNNPVIVSFTDNAVQVWSPVINVQMRLTAQGTQEPHFLVNVPSLVGFNYVRASSCVLELYETPAP